MNDSIKSIVIAIPSVTIIGIAFFFSLIVLYLGLTIPNLIGLLIFIFCAVAAKNGIRSDSWNWVLVSVIALLVGWGVVYGANINAL